MSSVQPIDEALFADLVEGVLDAGRAAELARLLRGNAAAQDAYLDYVETHASLVWHLTDVASHAGPRAVESIPHRPRAAWAGYAIAAALAVAGVGLAVYLALGFAGADGSPTPVHTAPVGTLVWSEGPVVGDEPLNSGDSFGPQTVQTRSGEAEFLLTSGTRLELAPASRLSIRGPMNAALAAGEARFDCPPQAVGYTVHLPGGVRVVDLGTRFRVRVEPTGRLGVTVLEGRVSIESTGPDGAADSRIVGEGVTWSLAPDAGVSITQTALPITPIQVTASDVETAFGEDFSAANLFEPDALGGFATADELTGQPVTTTSMWVTPSHPAGGVRPTITIDLGRDCEVTALLLWNYNHAPEAAWLNGVNAFAVSTAGDAEGPGSLPTEASAGAMIHRARRAISDDAEPAQRFDLPPVRARYVRLHLLTNHGGDRFGLSELRVVGGALTSPEFTVAPPEGASTPDPEGDNRHP